MARNAGEWWHYPWANRLGDTLWSWPGRQHFKVNHENTREVPWKDEPCLGALWSAHPLLGCRAEVPQTSARDARRGLSLHLETKLRKGALLHAATHRTLWQQRKASGARSGSGKDPVPTAPNQDMTGAHAWRPCNGSPALRGEAAVLQSCGVQGSGPGLCRLVLSLSLAARDH